MEERQIEVGNSGVKSRCVVRVLPIVRNNCGDHS